MFTCTAVYMYGVQRAAVTECSFTATQPAAAW